MYSYRKLKIPRRATLREALIFAIDLTFQRNLIGIVEEDTAALTQWFEATIITFEEVEREFGDEKDRAVFDRFAAQAYERLSEIIVAMTTMPSQIPILKYVLGDLIRGVSVEITKGRFPNISKGAKSALASLTAYERIPRDFYATEGERRSLWSRDFAAAMDEAAARRRD